MKILLLEDDLILNEIISEFLIEQGYDVDNTYDGEKAYELSFDNLYDMYILDVNVPNMNGFSLLKELRQRQIMAPAIFITSLNTSQDMEKGFLSGGNDYIKKPFELKELELRINNLKRQFHIDEDKLFDINEDVKYNFNSKSILLLGDEVKLAKKEALILEYFLKNPNRIISGEELISNIWQYEENPVNSTLRTYIKNIRKVLGENIIITLKGVGYRFNKG